MKQRAIICDIDECLLDSSQPLLMSQRAIIKFGMDSGMDMFYSNLHLCKRNEWCFELLERMTKNGDIVVLFITGRSETARKHTEAYLNFKNDVPYLLYMRPKESKEDDHIVKRKILERIIDDYEILFALDDRESNCCMYRSFGITTLKVDSQELH